MLKKIEEAMENDEPITVLDDHHENFINNDREEKDEEEHEKVML